MHKLACRSDADVAWVVVLCTYFGVLLIPGLLLSLFMFNVLSMWKEIKHLSTSTSLVSLNVMVGVAIFNGVRDIPSASFIVLSIVICVSMGIILVAVYWPLVYYVFSQRKALRKGQNGGTAKGIVEANIKLDAEGDTLDEL